MKKILLSLLFLLIFALGSAQSTIAKLKFEEAEEAFAAKDYVTTVNKLNDAEKILGKTNPPMLYLRIMTEYELLANPLTEFKDLDQLRKHISFYLENYDTIKSVEDQYREVYKISSKLEAYPTTAEAFAQEKQEGIIALRKMDPKDRKITEVIHAGNGWSHKFSFNAGDNLEEFKEKTKYLTQKKLWRYDDDGSFDGVPKTSYSTYNSKANNIDLDLDCGIDGYSVDKNNKVVMYVNIFHCGEDKLAEHQIAFTKIKDWVNQNLDMEFVRESKKEYVESIIISVPESTTNPKISYYVCFSLRKFNRKSAVQVLFVTDTRLTGTF